MARKGGAVKRTFLKISAVTQKQMILGAFTIICKNN